MLLYDFALRLLQLLFHLVWKGVMFRGDSKLRKFVMGQQGLVEHIAESLQTEQRRRLWVHASSYGEYNVARPLLRHIRQHSDMAVVLTFFSSTGYEMLSGKDSEKTGADYVFYLPLDTRRNAIAFLDALRPERAVFMISEFWMNYLCELQRRDVPTFVVSALITDESYLLRRWYGRTMRRALKAMDTFIVHDERSRRNLESIGFTNVAVTGDPLFDNAIETAASPYSDAVIERFCSEAAGNGVFIAGSIHPDQDLLLVSTLVKRHSDVRFIIVPHETDEKGLEMVEESLGQGRSKRYSQIDATMALSSVQVMIVDFVGALSRIYRYGQWAYVGGGFTPYLHSVIEPTVYGLPVSFGPNTKRKMTPQQMADSGIGRRVTTADELDEWFSKLQDPQTLTETKEKALRYAKQNSGSTEAVVNIIMGKKERD